MGHTDDVEGVSLFSISYKLLNECPFNYMDVVVSGKVEHS